MCVRVYLCEFIFVCVRACVRVCVCVCVFNKRTTEQKHEQNEQISNYTGMRIGMFAYVHEMCMCSLSEIQFLWSIRDLG